MGGMNTPHVRWDDPSMVVASDSARTARYRRLQSWYREVQLGVDRPGIGANRRPVASMLPTDVVAAQPDLNFVVPAAYEHAERRIREVRAEGGTLEEDRLRRNLLSSMPLCFNIFGALGGHRAFLDLLRRLIDPAASRIDDVVCESAPRPAGRYLGDRSAFDALVTYDHLTAGRRFLGVETKYTEPFSPTVYPSPTYGQVAEACGWFTDGATAPLLAAPTNQLFRTLLLAAAFERTDAYERGEILLLTLADDVRAQQAVAVVRTHLLDQGRLHHVTYEQLVDVARTVGDPYLAGWADRFALRYLDPASVGPDRCAHPDGPRYGRALGAPGGAA